MSFIVERLTIIGVGLIGGSFARALRQAGVVKTIIGVDRDISNLKQAQSLGIVDEISENPCEGVRDADVVFISVPVCSIPAVVQQIAASLGPGCIVTDGGSVKAGIVSCCERLIPEGRHFVGGHPIAGTEYSGAAASFATLYKNKRCILTPTTDTDPTALALISHLWQSTGADVCSMDAQRHDRIFAEISHLPHMVAYSLVHAVGTADAEGEDILSYSAGGFRDFTRIASSDPAMWRDIAIMNHTALLASIDGFSSSLAVLRASIEQGDGEGLVDFFTKAKCFRDGIK
ncbi:prephenate dehydrogenase [Pelotalea chapellei]|uniref:Prephenate dehydrogenase/arogenate dehydrogenase family protein n=1 Tax=Pelotalea chapellei TaxID=44671 RepID=A0ABS5U5S3_9BACT|nr:prephenate dehydrogenase/arogenate dehydrogenase family protein [Pelotalea chapellei]MBT1071003.1 prephenate dehydrogenase/arogenate dehydrogenase family protein [Pelotalea chapellei]